MADSTYKNSTFLRPFRDSCFQTLQYQPTDGQVLKYPQLNAESADNKLKVQPESKASNNLAFKFTEQKDCQESDQKTNQLPSSNSLGHGQRDSEDMFNCFQNFNQEQQKSLQNEKCLEDKENKKSEKNKSQVQILKVDPVQNALKTFILQNIKLKQQNKKLSQKIVNLQVQNKNLKQNITIYQTKYGKKSVYESTHECVNQQFRYEDKVQSNPKGNSLNQSVTNHPLISFFNKLDLKDQQKQFYQQNFKNNYCQKLPPKQSPFIRFADFYLSVVDISYKSVKLEDFYKNFFSFDWSKVQILKLDGNSLGNQGFEEICQTYWPNLKQISVGYNQIFQVKNLQRFPKLAKIDLRANPLTQKCRSYLSKLKSQRKDLEILF